MKVLPLILIGLMALAFLFCVVIIVMGNIYDRRATRKQQKIHQSYFRQ